MADVRDSITDKLDEDLELLARHLELLYTLKNNGATGIIRLSETLGVPKHKIRYSLRLLEKDGAILPTPDGAVATDIYDEYMDAMREYLAKLKGDIERLEDRLSATL